MSAPDLQPLRRAIDGVDHALADLLVCRSRLSRQVQAAKGEAGLPIVDLEREAEITQRYDRTAPGAASVAAAILQWCRRHEDH